MEKKAPQPRLEKLADDLDSLLRSNLNVASEKSPNSIEADPLKYKEEAHLFLKKLYDFLAQNFGYKSIDHMISVAHTLVIARAIAEPTSEHKNLMKSIEQVQANIRPKGETGQGKLGKGESKNEILRRMREHFAEPVPELADPEDGPLPS